MGAYGVCLAASGGTARERGGGGSIGGRWRDRSSDVEILERVFGKNERAQTG